MANAQDVQFLQQAAFLSGQEIADGLTAAQLSPGFAVRQFGTQEVTDHTSLNNLLRSIAALEGLPAPPQLSALFQAQINGFEAAFGPNSDTQYLSTEVAGHQQALLLYQAEALGGADPLLRAYAQGSVGILQGHLSQASSLLALNNSSTFG